MTSGTSTAPPATSVGAPRRLEPAVVGRPVEAAPASAAGPGVAPAIRVLLVEDDNQDVYLLRDMLAEAAAARFSVVRAERLSQALLQLAQQSFDVVLLDLVLPDSLELETLRAVRARARTVPIVILSGLDDEEFRLRAVQAGAQDYLVKGRITPDVLVRAIRYAIERMRSEEALQASEERFRSAFDYAGTGMALVSSDGHWLKVNRALCEMLGYSEQELLTRTLQLVIHGEDLPAHWEHLRKLMGRQIPYYQVENRCIHRGGDLLWVLVSVSCVQGVRGAPPYFIFQLQDISARKQAEDALRAVAEQAQTRNQVITAEDEARRRLMEERYHGPWEGLWKSKQALEWALHRTKKGTPLGRQELDYLNNTLEASLTAIKQTLSR